MTLGPDLLLNPDTHDLDLTSGDSQMEVDLAQAIKINLLFVRTEWFLNPTKGVPYFEVVWQKPVNVGHATAAFRDAILNTPGVDRITALSVDFDNALRKFTLTFTADTDQGEIADVQVVAL